MHFSKKTLFLLSTMLLAVSFAPTGVEAASNVRGVEPEGRRGLMKTKMPTPAPTPEPKLKKGETAAPTQPKKPKERDLKGERGLMPKMPTPPPTPEPKLKKGETAAPTKPPTPEHKHEPKM